MNMNAACLVLACISMSGCGPYTSKFHEQLKVCMSITLLPHAPRITKNEELRLVKK